MKRLAIGILIIAFSSCAKQDLKWIDHTEHSVVSKSGITSVDGVVYTGIIYGMYEGGDTAFVQQYAGGRKNGLYKVWYEGGQQKLFAHFVNDVYDGNLKEWFPNGQLYRNFNYVNGQEQGMQTMYWDNGKLRANYESKNGRKYGLTGIKNCSSPWGDSVEQLLAGGM